MHIPVPVHKVCVNFHSFLKEDFEVILYSLATIAVVGNGLLLLLLLHPRGKVLGQYRYLLVSFAVTDIVIALFHAWYISVILRWICNYRSLYLPRLDLYHIKKSCKLQLTVEGQSLTNLR